MTKKEQQRIARLARVAKRQPWRVANIRAGQVTLMDHYDARFPRGDQLTKAGREARELFDRLYEDASVLPADDVPCDRCGNTLPPHRHNMCETCEGDE